MEVILTERQRVHLIEIIDERIDAVRGARDRVLAETECEHCIASQRQTVGQWLVELQQLRFALTPPGESA